MQKTKNYMNKLEQ